MLRGMWILEIVDGDAVGTTNWGGGLGGVARGGVVRATVEVRGMLAAGGVVQAAAV